MPKDFAVLVVHRVRVANRESAEKRVIRATVVSRAKRSSSRAVRSSRTLFPASRESGETLVQSVLPDLKVNVVSQDSREKRETKVFRVYKVYKANRVQGVKLDQWDLRVQ